MFRKIQLDDANNCQKAREKFLLFFVKMIENISNLIQSYSLRLRYNSIFGYGISGEDLIHNIIKSKYKFHMK